MMNWYYVRDGQQDGPHSDEALQQLAGSGRLDAATLVWREGMADWLPISQAAPHLLPHAPPPTTGVEEACCAECGSVLPAAEMVTIQGAQVCARCKPLRLQKLREVVAAFGRGGDWARLLRVAKAQRGVNLCILLAFACYALLIFGGAAGEAAGRPPNAMALVPLVAFLGLLVVLVFQVIYVYRLASSLEVGVPIIWVLGVLFLSCIGLLLLLVLSSKATKQLRDAGFKVGLLGANPKDIEQRLSR